MKVRIEFPPCNSCGLCREVCDYSAIRPTLLEPRHLYEVIPGKMHRLPRVPGLLPGARRTGAIRVSRFGRDTCRANTD